MKGLCCLSGRSRNWRPVKPSNEIHSNKKIIEKMRCLSVIWRLQSEKNIPVNPFTYITGMNQFHPFSNAILMDFSWLHRSQFGVILYGNRVQWELRSILEPYGSFLTHSVAQSSSRCTLPLPVPFCLLLYSLFYVVAFLSLNNPRLLDKTGLSPFAYWILWVLSNELIPCLQLPCDIISWPIGQLIVNAWN